MHKPNAIINDLKKGDKFKFNYEVFTVKRRFINDDDKPLLATDSNNEEHEFSHEGLEIEKL